MRLKLLRPVEVPRQELLRYARCRSEAGLEAVVDQAIQQMQAVMEPKAAAACFALNRRQEGLYMAETLLPGKAIQKHLEGCGSCWLLGVTLGFGVDRTIAAAGQSAPSLALLLDAAATAAVEDLADAACEALAAGGRELTGRFSAGYGDLPLELQPVLLDMLRAQWELGMTTGPSLLLSPIKSVTALVGVRGKDPMI